MLRQIRTILLLMAALVPANRLAAHGYIFSRTLEEMKDQITIYVAANQIKIQYESVYLGQIAPHIRNLMDSNSDFTLTKYEVDRFFSDYKETIQNTLKEIPLFIGTKSSAIQLTDMQAPTIYSDSLLAPFFIKMVFTVNGLQIKPGDQELVIDPKLLFINGNHFIRMAKERLNFTEAQEKAIARFLQIKIFASDAIQFTSTFPGYIKKDKKSIYIYGVFYDNTILLINKSQYPKLCIKFKRT